MAQGTKRRGRVFIYLALILVLGLVLVWVVIRGGGAGSISGVSPNQPVEEEMVNIVITNQVVHRGDILTETDLKTISYPKKNYVEGTFYTKTSDLVGKRVASDLNSNFPVTSSVIADSAEGSSAAFQIPTGMVAISIPIDKLSSISYAPLPGDRVSIIASMRFIDLDQGYQTILPNHMETVNGPMDPNGQRGITAVVDAPGTQGRIENEPGMNQPVYIIPSEPQRSRLVSQLLIQDVTVLQVGIFPLSRLEKDAPAQAAPQPQAAPAQENPDQPAPVAQPPQEITLIVRPQDALTLNYMLNSEAQLTLVLRGLEDNQPIQTEAVTLQYILDQYNIPLPPKLPYGTEPRIDVLRLPEGERLNSSTGTP